MHIESEVARQYGWSPESIGALPASDVCQHFLLLKLHDAEERMWSLQSSAYPHMTKAGQTALLGTVNVLLSQIRGDQRGDLKTYSREDRIRLIGGAMRSRSRSEWESRHPDEIKWLASVGVSVDDAIRESEAMHNRAVAELQSVAAMPKGSSQWQIRAR